MPKGKLQHKYDTICCESFQALRTLKGDFFIMQSILDNLYYGNLCPSEKPLIPGSPAEKAHAAFNDAAIQLEQTLSGTEKELFEAFADANQELCECSCCEYFSDGFRLGSPNDARDSPGRVHRSFTA